jgi:hypothetical protein
MKKITFSAFLLAFTINSILGQTSTEIKYLRATYNDDPATTICIGWTGVDATIYYGTTDFGTNYTQYPSNAAVTKTTNIYSLVNKFCDLKNLSPKRTYYFVLRESNGKLSKRYSFRTMSDNSNDPISFISGGDTRDGIVIENCNCRGERQKAFRLLGKVCTDFIAFSGDFAGGPQQALFKSFTQQWQEWFTDWQLSIDTTSANRLLPIIPAMGNHEESANNLSFFNIPTTTNYFGITFGGNLMRIISLNTELGNNATQISWFQNDLINNNSVLWKAVQYHKPMVPQGHYSPEPLLINNWGTYFEPYGVRLAMEGHTHIYKVTYPAKKSGGSGNNYFVRNDTTGTVFIGEGNMGAPYRTNLYSKFAYTREIGKSFTSFFHVRVSKDTMKIITVLVNAANDSKSFSACNTQGQQLRSDIDIYDAPDGATNDPVVLIPRSGFSDFSYVTTGIKNNSKILDVASLYPNPAEDNITIKFSKELKNATIEMYDAMGRHIQSLYQKEDYSDISIDLSYVNTGVYFLYIKTDDGIQTLKFFKK